MEKNAKDIGIRRQRYHEDVYLHYMLRMSKVLALLPPNMVIDGFEEVKRQASLSPNQDVVVRYIRYFQAQWIEREFLSKYYIYAHWVFIVPTLNNNKE